MTTMYDPRDTWKECRGDARPRWRSVVPAGERDKFCSPSEFIVSLNIRADRSSLIPECMARALDNTILKFISDAIPVIGRNYHVYVTHRLGTVGKPYATIAHESCVEPLDDNRIPQAVVRATEPDNFVRAWLTVGIFSVVVTREALEWCPTTGTIEDSPTQQLALRFERNAVE